MGPNVEKLNVERPNLEWDRKSKGCTSKRTEHRKTEHKKCLIIVFYYNITVFKQATAMIESSYSWLILAYFWRIFDLLHNELTDEH